MSTRISSLLLALALAGCGGAKTPSNATASEPPAPDDERVACAHLGAPLARDCTVDRMEGANGLELTIRHPDGGFHRLLVTKDGRGVIAADGAVRAKVSVVDANQIEVVIGGDRYRLPATVKGAPARS